MLVVVSVLRTQQRALGAVRGKVSGDYYNGNGAVADSNGTGDLDVDV